MKKWDKKDTPRFATRGIIDYYGLFNKQLPYKGSNKKPRGKRAWQNKCV